MASPTDYKIYLGKSMIAQASTAHIAGQIIEALWGMRSQKRSLIVKLGGRIVFNSKRDNPSHPVEVIIKQAQWRHQLQRRERVAGLSA